MSFLAYPVTDEQKKIVATAGTLADVFAQRSADYDWEGRFPLENFTDLHQAGYLTLTVPRDLGGQGASLLDIVLGQFRLAQGDASTALVTSMHLMHMARLGYGRTEYSPLYRQICQRVVEDGAMINSAVSEPATGSPSRGGRPQTTAYRQPDGSWRIKGRKNFTTGSYALYYIMVGCSIEDLSAEADGLKPLTVDKGNFLVTRDTPGVSFENTWNTVGMRGTGSNDLILDDVHIDADAYIEERIPPIPEVQGQLAAWTALTAAVYLGIGQAARDEAVRYAKQRRPNFAEAIYKYGAAYSGEGGEDGSRSARGSRYTAGCSGAVRR